MSVMLYVLGTLACLAGALTTAFGLSIELSFGNSLVVAGISAVVGGLIVVGLGGVVSQLQRLVEALNGRAPLPLTRMPAPFEAARALRPAAQVPFPPKPMSIEPRSPQPPAPPPPVTPPASPVTAERTEIPEPPREEHVAAAPMLTNPEEVPQDVHDNVSLSPVEPATPPASGEAEEVARSAPPLAFGTPDGLPPEEPETERRWRFPTLRRRAESAPPPAMGESPPASHFDAMWPSAQPAEAEPAPKLEPYVAPVPEAKHGVDAEDEPEPATRLEPEGVSSAAVAPASPPAEPETPPPAGTSGAHAVAILKSGVVDGMGYTLYVDGSIEAELPQGTLRFSSINDLRDYLEKNG